MLPPNYNLAGLDCVPATDEDTRREEVPVPAQSLWGLRLARLTFPQAADPECAPVGWELREPESSRGFAAPFQTQAHAARCVLLCLAVGRGGGLLAI